MTAPQVDPTEAPRPTPSPRRRWAMAVAAVGGTALVAGGTVAAAGAWADDTPTDTGGYDTPAEGGPGRGGPGGPGGGGPDGLLAGDLGEISALSDTELTLTTDAGGTETYTLSADTEIGGGPEAAGAALAVGQRVSVVAEDGDATAVRIVHAHVDGTVTAVGGGELTVIERDGFVITVVPGDDVDVADIAVGDSVRAAGTVDDDGRTLLADEVTEGEIGRGDFPPDPDGGPPLPGAEDSSGVPTPPDAEDGSIPAPSGAEDGSGQPTPDDGTGTVPAPGDEDGTTTAPDPDSGN